MPIFTIETPSGKRLKIEAPDQETAIRGAQDFEEGRAAVEPPPPTVGTSEDMARSALAGIRQGAEGMAGMMGDAANMSGDVARWGAEKLGLGETGQKAARFIGSHLSPTSWMPSTSDIQQVTNPVMGESYKPQTTAGEYARTVGQFVPGAALGPGGVVRKTVMSVAPGVASEAAGQATKGTAAEPYARAAGALAGGMVPSALKRLVSPFPISAERAAQAKVLEGEGVPLTAGQKTGSDRLRYMESELGGMAGQRMMEQQGEKFTASILKRAGINANRATPEVLDDGFNRIGQQFDDLASRNTLNADPKLLTDMRKTIREYSSLVPPNARAPVVENMTADIASVIKQHGVIPGPTYQALRSRLDRLARSAKNDPQLSEALSGLRTALDDAMERTLAKTNPQDLGAWRQARREYRNILVIEKAASGAGENAAQGIISPSALRNATVQQNRRSYVRGKGDFAELARAGEALLKPLPQSGTAPRTAARAIGATLPAFAGGMLGGGGTLGMGALAGAAAGAAAPFAIGRAMLSAPGRAYLTNQMATGIKGLDPRAAALLLGSSSINPRLAPPSR